MKRHDEDRVPSKVEKNILYYYIDLFLSLLLLVVLYRNVVRKIPYVSLLGCT